VDPITTLKAEKKIYKESVVMVHHYGGNKFSFKRTMEFLNSIGLDVYTFDLPYSDVRQVSRLPTYKKGFGLRHKWADIISTRLEQVPGDKFVFSLSSPSAAALDAMAEREFRDIKGWVCDGGPFADLQTGMTNLVREAGLFGGKYINRLGLKNSFVPKIYSNTVGWLLINLYGSRNYENDMARFLKKLPKDFPIISFREGEDKLVYPQMIDQFFALASVQVQPVLLEKAGHLLGFKEAPERYETFLLDYFKRNGTLLDAGPA
jgi:hypothetical protein